MGFQPLFTLIFALFAIGVVAASPPIDPLRCAEQITTGDPQQVEKLLKNRIESFSPDRPQPADPNLRAVHFLPAQNTPSRGVDGSGWDGEVRFAEYDGVPAAVKFFKKVNFADSLERTPTAQDYSNKIWQGYFLLSAVATLDLAPHPYAYTINPEMVDTLAIMAGLPPSHHYGVIIMERVFPAYQDKPALGTALQKSIADKYTESIKKAKTRLGRFGIITNDLDFFVEDSGNFRFMDLDFWRLKNSRGCWHEGQPCP